MPEANHDLGLVSRLNVEARGKPGKRTFLLQVDSPLGSAVIWLEKEQLLELSLHLKRTVGLMEEKPETVEPPPADLGSRDLSIEFKMGKQAIEFDEGAGVFRFWNHEAEDDSEVATVVFEANLAQVEEFSDESLKVCSSGRPICQLCHQPIDPDGHFCIRSNGHPINASERLG